MKIPITLLFLLTGIASLAQTKESTTGLLGNANPLISMEKVKINDEDLHTWHLPSLMAFSPDEFTLYFRNPVNQVISSWNLISLKRTIFLPSAYELFKEGREALAAFTPSNPLPFSANVNGYRWLDGSYRLDMKVDKNYNLSLTVTDTAGTVIRKFELPNFTASLKDWAKKKRYGSSISGNCLVSYSAKTQKLLLSVNYNMSNIISKYNASFVLDLANGQLTALPCTGIVHEEPDFPAPHMEASFANNYLVRYYNEERGKRNFEITSLKDYATVDTGTIDPDVIEQIVAYDEKKQQVVTFHYNHPYGIRTSSDKTYCLQWIAKSGIVAERLWIDYGKDQFNKNEDNRMAKNYPLIISKDGRFFAFSGIYKPGEIDNHYYGICYDLLSDAKYGYMKSLHEPNLGKAVVPDNYQTAVINGKE